MITFQYFKNSISLKKTNIYSPDFDVQRKQKNKE